MEAGSRSGSGGGGGDRTAEFLAEVRVGFAFLVAEADLSPRVVAAVGFANSCVPEVGRLFGLAVAAKPYGVVSESGTGSSVGTAWLHSGLGAGARLVTVEREQELARRAAGVFADDDRVSVPTGGWRLLAPGGLLTWTPLKYSQHRPVQRLLRYFATST